jgi:hypothetical protein
VSAQAAKELYFRWINELWKGDEAGIRKALPEIVSGDFVGYWPERTIKGRKEMETWVTTGITFINDLDARVTLGPVVDGDILSARWELTGTFAGGLPQCTAPVGSPVRIPHTDFLRFKDGRFTECWAGSDQVNTLKQLGATTLTACQWFDNGAALGV